MKNLIYPLLAALLVSCGPTAKDAEKEKANAALLSVIKAEPKVKDAVITDADVLYVGVADDGTRRDGYAEYLCRVVKDNHGTVNRVKVVRAGSHNSPDKDNAYGKLLGESTCP